ncbi:adenosylcobinamide-GDP ribazoletransferase [Paludifilum halophilum]
MVTVTGWLAFVARRRLGGMTGDVYGAVAESTEAVILLLWLQVGGM